MQYPSYKGILREVFGCENLVASFEFPSHLEFLMEALPASHPCADFEGLERLTMLPWHAPFLPAERSKQIRLAMLGTGGIACWNRVGVTASRLKRLEFLRFCPECLRADHADGRTPYWRRLHQLTGIEVCPEHKVWLENSDVSRRKQLYRYSLPSEDLLVVNSRPITPADVPLTNLAKLGCHLLSRQWPNLQPADLRRNYLVLLRRAGYINTRGCVSMRKLSSDLKTFYPRTLLRSLGCSSNNWLIRIVRAVDSIQQPIRHLLLLNFLGSSLEDLFEPAPVPKVAKVPPFQPPVNCINHLCSELAKPAAKFQREERSSMFQDVIQLFCCESCGQVQARFLSGPERTWIRDYGQLWRQKLEELWADPKLSLRAISKLLHVSSDAARRNIVKLGLPLKRPGRRIMSVKGFPHLLVSKTEKRRRKLELLRRRWLKARTRHPDFGVRGLKTLIPAVYATLYRYDRDWLKANQPPRRKRPLKVNWNHRDLALCERMNSASAQLRNLRPFKLARAVGIIGWIPSRLSRLPNARKLWSHLSKLAIARRN